MSTSTAEKRVKRTRQGEQTHRQILDRALHIASIHGLEGLTIGRLASDLNMSKSGLFAHFGSKEGLQLATVKSARSVFMEEVTEPARKLPHGIERVWKLCEGWLRYIEGEVFQGGCFFASASMEFDNKPGQVRDTIAKCLEEWMYALAYTVKRGVEAGEIKEGTDAEQVAFEIQALGLGANWALQLYENRVACKRARFSIISLLNSISTRPDPGLPQPERVTPHMPVTWVPPCQ